MPPDDEEAEEPVPFGTVASQSRALEAGRGAVAAMGGATLLASTGPLAELRSAERRGILDEARRLLIAKKGRGVQFEANTLAHLQETAVRFDLQLRASLPATSNNPGVDLFIEFQQEEVLVQLKAGSDRYLRAAIKARADGIVLVVPRDAAAQPWATGATGTLTFEDVVVETPTRDELLRHAEKNLDRLSRGEPVVSDADISRRAFCDGLIDGIVAVAIDLCLQKLLKPDQPVDWRRSTKCLVRTAATSAACSFLAATNARAALSVTSRSIDATATFRSARVAGSVVPHAVDVGFDALRRWRGELSDEQFMRSTSGHAGAAAVEYLAFPYLARLAARLGPLGVVVLLVGGAIASKVGNAVGQKVFDLFSSLPPLPAVPSSNTGETVGAGLVRAFEWYLGAVEKEADRRAKLGEKRLCEEPRCGRKHHARGWCARHYQRWYRRQRRLDTRLYSWRGAAPERASDLHQKA